MSAIERLYYLAGSALPSAQANSIHVAHMSEALATRVNEFKLFAKSGHSLESLAEYYGWDHSPQLELVPFNSRASLVTYLRKLKHAPLPDLAYGRYLYPLLYMAKRRVQIGYEIHVPAQGYKRWLEQRLFSHGRLRLVVFITQALADDYLARYPMLKAKALVLADAAKDPGEPTPIREAGALRVAYVGSFHQGRGVEQVLSMARALPDMQFVLAGGQLQGSVPPNVQCLGFVAPAQTRHVLRDADVLLAPYQDVVRMEGNRGDIANWASPLKFFEYMSHGKAILASDKPVYREVLADGVNALLLSHADVGGWCNALKELDRSRRAAQELGNAARRDFLAHYTWSVRAEKLLARLREQ